MTQWYHLRPVSRPSLAGPAPGPLPFPLPVRRPGLAPALLVAAVALLLPGCFRKEPPPPYLQLKVESGRLYYADSRTWMRSRSGGFLTFRDMVTGESVRLAEGSYEAVPVTYAEVERARDRYMYHPSQPPHVDNTPQRPAQG
jgi:hypothetical protein